MKILNLLAVWPTGLDGLRISLAWQKDIVPAIMNLYNIIVDAKEASTIVKKYQGVYDRYEKKLLKSTKDKFRQSHLKAITAYEEAYKIYKWSELYWMEMTNPENCRRNENNKA